MLYIEPAPYILDLIRVIRQRHPDVELRVYFIAAALSQNWGSRLDGIAMQLPTNRFLALKLIFSEIVHGDFDVLHLAGWGERILLASIFFGAIFNRRITVESDTQLPIGQSFIKRRIKNLIYPSIFYVCDILFPGGSRQRDYFRHYGVPENKIKIAQMTVDVRQIMCKVDEARQIPNFWKSKWDLPLDGVLFLYVGRLDVLKGGIHDLVEAFSMINEEFNAYLVIAGEGELRPFVEASAKNNDRIIYLGRLEFDQIPGLYGMCDVLILPSHNDNWGLVVNEAMAAALPVIASKRVGCVDDLVEHGVTGFLFQAHDIGDLATSMIRLAEHESLRVSMGKAGRNKISGWTLEDESDILCKNWKKLVLGIDNGE